MVFAYIVYKSRADRDRVNAKVMKDPRLANMMDPKALPFDGKRMFWGGFKAWSIAEWALPACTRRANEVSFSGFRSYRR